MITVTGLKPPTALLAYPEAIRKALPEIAEQLRTDIINESQNGLGPETSRDYAAGVQLLHYPISGIAMNKGRILRFATVTLTGWLPNALESGWGGGDMKPALLNGRNAKTNPKTGVRYNTVPFRHGSPTSAGHAGTPMGQTEMKKKGLSRAQAELLGKRIHKEAKKLEASTSHADNATKWGQRLAARTAGVRKLKPQHKTDIYAGMVKVQKTYQKAVGTKYMTFRRVSDNSPSGSWLHGGINAHHFFEKGEAKIKKNAAIIFKGVLTGVIRARV